MSKRQSNSGHEPYQDDAIDAFASELVDERPEPRDAQPRSPVPPSPPHRALVIASPPTWPDPSFERPDVSTFGQRESSSPRWSRLVRVAALVLAFLAGAVFAVLIQQRSAAPASAPLPQSDSAASSAAVQTPVEEVTAPTLPPPEKTVVPPETITEPIAVPPKESAPARDTPKTAKAATTATSTAATRTPSSAEVTKQAAPSPPRAVDVPQPSPRPVATVPVSTPPPESKETPPPESKEIETAARIEEPSVVTPPAPNPPPPAPTAPSPTAVAPRADAAVARPSAIELDNAAIQGTLNRYRTAFNALDAGAATQVWPSVNERALARAFERLEEQVVSLGVCRIDVKASRAQATCSGTLRYVPRIGSQTAHVDRRQWTFDLRKVRGEWLIESVDAR